MSLRPRRIVGASLKTYLDLHQTAGYMKGFAGLGALAKEQGIDLFVIPDFVSLLSAKQALEGTSILLGAQDTFWEDRGAYTGEVSPLTLKQAGVSIVAVGHAERRRIFGETDDQVSKKAAAVARNNLIPLICVGEKTHSAIASADVGVAIDECRTQVLAALSGIPNGAEIIIAYEPVWAIGATQPANSDHVVNVVKAIRQLTARRHGRVRILYGGSAGPGMYVQIAGAVDGLFLGRAGLELDNLALVIKEVGGA